MNFFKKNSKYQSFKKTGLFSEAQMDVIRLGLKKNLNVDSYAYPSLSVFQMECLEDYLENGYDYTKDVNPSYSLSLFLADNFTAFDARFEKNTDEQISDSFIAKIKSMSTSL